MNSLPLRNLIRKYGALGYLIVGCYLLGYWLFHFKRRQTAAILILLALTSATVLWLSLNPPYAGEQTCSIQISAGQLEATRANAQSYTITDLGVLSGYEYSLGRNINANGQTAGSLGDRNIEERHGFFCTSTGKMSDIGTLGGSVSIPFGINNEGYVVGTSYTAKQEMRGFVWHNGKMTSVGTLGGPFSIAQGINNKGQIVGTSATSSGRTSAFLWQNGRIRDISARCPGTSNGATAINDHGDLAGVTTKDRVTVEAFVLSGGRSRILPTLGGTYTAPTAISTKAVVGIATLAGDNQIFHGFVATSSGIQDIGAFGGYDSFALGVNNSGQAVGMAQTKRGVFHAALWESGKLTDLNTLIPSGSGWVLIIASGINEQGRIVGTGRVGNTLHAFVLTPEG